MKKSTRVWLVVAICFTVYMIYFVGSGAVYAIDDFNAPAAIPFDFPMSRVEFQHRLNWVLGLALISWVVWGFSFVGEAAPSTPPAEADQPAQDETASPPGA